MIDERRYGLLLLMTIGVAITVFIVFATYTGRVKQVEVDVRRVCMLSADAMKDATLRNYCIKMYENEHGGTTYGGTYDGSG